MLKIVLLFLFCAISGYGINGHPSEKSSTPPEEKLILKVGGVPNLNNTNLNFHLNDTTAPPQPPSSNSSVTIPYASVTVSRAESAVFNTSNVENDNITAPTTEIIRNASTSVPMNKNLPKTTEDIPKTVTDYLNINDRIPPSGRILPPNVQNSTIIPPTTTTKGAVVPIPPPKDGNWSVNDVNHTCIIVKMAVQFNISMVKENKTSSKVFNLPNKKNQTTVTGECGKLEQYITLSWNDTENVTNNFTLHFTKNETMNQYSLHHLEVILSNPNDTVVLVHNAILVSTGLSNSYRCLKQQNFTLIQNGTDKITGSFLMSDLQFQAFKTDNTTDFGQVKDCKLDVPDIVPIAVGCALAGLVVIVLIAYLVGRKRSQGRGYLSM